MLRAKQRRSGGRCAPRETSFRGNGQKKSAPRVVLACVGPTPMTVRQLLGSGNVPNTVRAGAWYHYCFRTACSNLLHDLLVIHAASTVVLGGLVVSGVAWLVVHIGLRAPRAAVACGAAPLAVLLAMFAGREDHGKAMADSHTTPSASLASSPVR